MKKASQEQWREKIAKDVALVKENALGLITISPDNQSFDFIENKHPRLGVLAIIGPVQFSGQKIKEVLLTEIGIGPSRPYHEARGLNRQPSQSNICAREKYFFLNPEQYRLIAPSTYQFLNKLSRITIAKWKSPGFNLVVQTKMSWSHKHKKFMTREGYVSVSKGKRFSIDKREPFFLPDIYWAELNLNPVIIHKFNSIAYAIKKRADFYRYYQPYKGKKPFSKLKINEDIKICISSNYEGKFYPLYWREAIFEKLSKSRSVMFYHEIKELFNLNSQPSKEQKLARQAPKIGNPKQRLDKIQLRVTSGLEKDNDFIVFEVHASPDEEFARTTFSSPTNYSKNAEEIYESETVPF